MYIYIYVFKALKTCGKNAPKHFLKMHHSTMNNIETTRKHNSCSPVLLCFLHIFNVFFKLFNVFMFSIILCVFRSCSCFFYHSLCFLYCFLCFCLRIYIAANLCLLTYLQLQFYNFEQYLYSFKLQYCTYLPTYLLTYLHTYILTYLHTYILTYLHTYIHTYIHTWMPPTRVPLC